MASSQHQTLVPGDRLDDGGVGVGALSRRRSGGAVGPGQEPGLLVQHGGGGQPTLRYRLGHRSPVPAPGQVGRHVRLQLHAAAGGEGGQLVDQGYEALARASGAGGEQGGDVAGDVGVQPGARLGTHADQGLGHHGLPVNGGHSR